jgi:uncharacterized protein (DUF433 family)
MTQVVTEAVSESGQETVVLWAVALTMEVAWLSIVVKATMDKGRMTILDWSQCPAVESVPGKLGGAWVLKGTRMPVSAIFENLESGANIDDIMEWFEGLDREQVKAVIEFAARSLDKPPVYAP